MSEDPIKLDTSIIGKGSTLIDLCVSTENQHIRLSPRPKPRTKRASKSPGSVLINRITAEDRKAYSEDQEAAIQQTIQAIEPDRRLIRNRRKTETSSTSRLDQQKVPLSEKTQKSS